MSEQDVAAVLNCVMDLVLGDDTTNPNQRAEQWSEALRRVARRATSGFDTTIQQTIDDQTCELIEDGLLQGRFDCTYETALPQFEAWVYRVCWHRAVDLARSRARDTTGVRWPSSISDAESTLPDRHPVASAEPDRQVQQRMDRLHRTVDAIQWRGAVGYRGLLLYRIRVGIALALARYHNADPPAGAVASTIEQWLPLTENDARQAFQQGLPNVGELWSRTLAWLTQHNYQITPQDICDLLRTPNQHIARPTWYKWCQRCDLHGRRWIQDHGPEHAWEELIQPILDNL